MGFCNICTWMSSLVNSHPKCCIFAFSFCLFSPIAFSNPTGGQVVAGSVTIDSHTANTVHINQASDKAIVNWHSFNINPNEATHFHQPSRSSVILNRIDSNQGASQIFGALTANGRVVLVNHAGILFGPGSRVDVGGIIASTSNISNENFLAGKYIFDQPSPAAGAVINQGTITAADYGLVALMGTAVRNDGVIQARLGNIILASGNKFTIDLYGDQLVNFSIDEASSTPGVDHDKQTLKNGVENNGTLLADGGVILMSAKSARGVLDNVINMQGVAEAKSVMQKNGVIILLGGNEGVVKVSGSINAYGLHSGEHGGHVKITGQHILVSAPAKINVSGDIGGGEILIGGDERGGGVLPHAQTTFLTPGTLFSADAITSGNGGKIIVWSKDATWAYGDFRAQGGVNSGNGGFVETSGKYLDVNGLGAMDLRAARGKFGTWLLDPVDVSIDDNATQNITYSGGVYTPTLLGILGVTLNAGELGTRLNTANVTVVTTDIIGLGSGDITLNDPANLLQTNWGNASTTLTLEAERNITITSNLSLSGSGKGLTLTAGTDLLTNTGSITINGTLNGNFDLIATSGATGSVTFNSLIGATTALSSIAATGASGITINTTGITTVGSQTYNNPVTLTSSTTETGGTIQFQSVALGVNSLTVNTTASDSSIAGLINGSGGLTKSGSGTLTLGNAANTYTGSTTINAGTLSINALANAGVNSSLGAPVGAAATILLGSASSATLSYTGNTTSTNRAFTIGGAGGGIIQATQNGATLSLSGNINNNGNPLTFNANTANITASGVISGLGSVTKNGSGTLLLSNVNTYSGATSINAGTLQLGIANAISANSNVTLANSLGANFDLNDFSDVIGSLSGGGTTGGNVDLGSATLNTGGDNSSTSYGGVISGTGNLVKSGSGTMVLSGAASSYTGSTTINAGTLSVAALANSGSNSSIGSAGAITLGSNTQATLLYTGGTTSTNRSMTVGGVGGGIIASSTGASTLTLSGNIDNNGNPITFDTNTGNITVSGIVSGSGNLTKTSSGILTLSGINTYSGSTSVNGGILSLGNSAGLGNTTGTVVSTGATLDIGFSNATLGNTNGITINGTGVGNTGAITLTGTTDVLNNAITLNSNSSIGGTGSATFNGVLSGLFSLTKVNSSTLTLTNANTYSGGTAIEGGTVRITHATALGSGNVNVASGASLSVVGSLGAALTNNLILNGTGVSSNGALIETGTNTLSGTVTLNSDSTLNVVGASDSLTLSGVISGANSLTKIGSGLLALSNANTYSNGTAINAGTVQITNATALGTGNVTVVAGAALSLLGSLGQAVTNNFTLNGSGISGNGALVETGTNILSGTIALSSDTTINVVGVSDALTLSGVVSGANSLIKIGNGLLALSNANTYSNGTAINAGTVQITNATALGTGNVSVASGAALSVLGSLGQAITNNLTLNGSGIGGNGALFETGTNTLSGTIALNSNSTINVVTGSDALILSGVVSGANSLTKIGNGSLTLSNASTYSGGTAINAGTLQATTNSAALGTGTVTVSSGAVLSLVGSLSSTMLNNLILNGSGISGNGALISTGTNILSGTIALNSDTTIDVVTGSDALTLSGVVSGANNLIKIGNGLLTLSNANTYSNGTTINAGTVQATSNAAALGTGNVTVASGAVLNIAGSLGGVLANNLILNGSGISGNGALVETGTNSLGGTVTLNSDTTINIATSSDALSISGVVSGASSLTKIGNGLLALSNANTYSNGTAINAGTIQITNATALGAGNVNVVSGAVLSLQGSLGQAITNNLTLNGSGISGNGALVETGTNTISGTIALNSATTVNVVGVSDVLTLSGVVSGTNSLTKSGTGLLALSNANTYSNGTTITAGTVQISNATALGTGNVNVASGAALSLLGSLGQAITNNFTLNGNGISGNGALIETGTNTLSGTIALNSNSTINVVTGSDALILSGVVSGTNSLTKMGNGSLTLSNASTYSGGTTINSGTLQATTNSAALGTGTVTVSSGAVLSLVGSLGSTMLNNLILNGSGISGNGALLSTGTNILSGTIALNSNTTIDVLTGSDALTLSGVVSGANTLIKIGNGLLTLSNANTYSNGTTINAGTVQATSNAAALGTGNVTVASGAVLNIAGSLGGVLANNLILNGSGISGNGALVETGTNSFSGTVALNTNASINIVTSSDALTLSGIVSGANDLTKMGDGVLTLSNTNTYSGRTFVTDGMLGIATTGSLGNTSQTSVASGAALNLTFSNGVLNNLNDITLNGSGVSNSGALMLTGSNITLNNSIDLASNSLIAGNGAGLMTLGGAIEGGVNLGITLNNAAISLPTITLTSGGNLTISSGGAITQTGALSGASLNAKTLNNIGAAITLSNAANDFSIINLSSRNVADNANTAGQIIYSNLNDVDVSGINTLTTINLSASGRITDSGSINGTEFTTNSVGGTILDFGHQITEFNATNSGGGNIQLINTANLLQVDSITQNNAGNVAVTNTGAMITNGLISTNSGNVILTTLTSNGLSQPLTINGNIQTSGGSINANSANPNNITALTVNGLLSTTPGTGGTLILGGGTLLTVSPIIGLGNITLQGNGLDLTLGTLNFTSSVEFSVNRFLTVNGTLSTSGIGNNITLVGDNGGSGVGGVFITSTGSVLSSGNLSISGSSLSGLGGADPTSSIELQNGSQLTAAGNITLSGNVGNNNIAISGAVQSTGAGNITIAPAGSGSILLGAMIESQGGNINLNAPINLVTDITINTNNGNLILGALTGGRNLTLNTGSLGDITFNGDASLATLEITNTHNIVNNALLNVSSYLQSAGNLTNFGSGGLISSGNASITTNNVIGNINLSSLTLGVSFANLIGTINGMSGVDAIRTIVQLNTLTPNTHFLNGIDMYLTTQPPLPPEVPTTTPPVTSNPPGTTPNNILNTEQYVFPQQPTHLNFNYNEPVITINQINNVVESIDFNKAHQSNSSSLVQDMPQPVANNIPATGNIDAVANATSDEYAKENDSLAENNLLFFLAFLTLCVLAALGKNKQIKQADSKLIADISFQVRTSLNDIIGFAELIKNGIGGAVSNQQNEYLSDILSGSNEILQWVNQVDNVKDNQGASAEFFAKMSFKLRTALNGIVGFTELLHNGLIGEMSAEQNEYLNHILSGSNTILQVANNGTLIKIK